MIVGLDGGNNATKTVGPCGTDIFVSDLGEYRERKLEQQFGNDDMFFEYEGRMGFAGTLARYESEFAGSMKGNTKAHEDCKLRILLALHRYSDEATYQIVVGQPIERHTEDEKQKIINMLIGPHTITVNGIKKSFTIKDVKVAAEGGAAFWSAPKDGLIRMLDVGSGTINGATLYNKRYIDKDSWSISFGANTTKTYSLEAMARAVATKASSWGKEDKIYLVGGVAEEMLDHIKHYYLNSEVLYPMVRQGVNFNKLHPVYANAVGFYNIARGLYG